MDDASSVPSPDLLGLRRFQKFGHAGPAYEVLGPGAKPGTVRVHVFDSREEFDYLLEHARDDPPA